MRVCKDLLIHIQTVKPTVKIKNLGMRNSLCAYVACVLPPDPSLLIYSNFINYLTFDRHTPIASEVNR
jgi:hypothetical protein